VSSVRILVVEDSKLFLQFISTTLATRRDLEVIGEVTDGLEAVEKSEELKPDSGVGKGAAKLFSIKGPRNSRPHRK
jgi:DNA-binding NarL/FixJ family response regulator